MRDQWEEKERHRNEFFASFTNSAEVRKSLSQLDEMYGAFGLVAKSIAVTEVVGGDLDRTSDSIVRRAGEFDELFRDGRRRPKLQRLFTRSVRELSREKLREFRKAVSTHWWPLVQLPAQVTPQEIFDEAANAVLNDRCDHEADDESNDYRAAVDEIAMYLSQQCRRPLGSRPRPVAVVTGRMTLSFDESLVWSNDHAALRYARIERKRVERLLTCPP